jgi:hypothetical protein
MGAYAIERRRGDTIPDVFMIKNAAGDITGYTIKFTLDTRKAPTDETTQLVQITATIVDGPTGHCIVPWNTTQADQDPATYYYDLQLIDTDGYIQTPYVDTYKFTQDINKDTT